MMSEEFVHLDKEQIEQINSNENVFEKNDSNENVVEKNDSSENVVENAVEQNDSNENKVEQLNSVLENHYIKIDEYEDYEMEYDRDRSYPASFTFSIISK